MVQAISIFVATPLLAACADPTTGIFRTKLDAEATLEAAATTFGAMGSNVKTNDTTGGSIYGEKYAMATWQLQVSVKPQNDGSELNIEVTPPPTAYGTTQISFDDYVYALRNRIPDLTVVSIQKDWQFNDDLFKGT